MGNETIQRPWRRFWGQSSLGVLPRSCKFFPQFSVINLCLFCLKEKKKILAFPCMQSTTKDIFFQVRKQRWGVWLGTGEPGCCAVAPGPLQHLLGLLSYPSMHGPDRATGQRAFPLYRCHYKTLRGQSPVNCLQEVV